jgi:predicted nucleic acid-binding Zn ribbon protein
VPEPSDPSDQSGQSDLPGQSGQIKRARDALAAARAQARAKGLRPAAPLREGGSGGADHVPGKTEPGTTPADAPGRRSRPGFPPSQDRADPQSLGAAINGLLAAEGWELAAATGSVFGRWTQIVGADLAGHTRPETLTDGELTISADSTAWATQVRLLAAQLVRRLNLELGDGTVRRVTVRGPVSPGRKPGEWRVRGSRGSRDTYG